MYNNCSIVLYVQCRQEGGFVTEEEFLNWMNVDPPATVWLTTLNRLAIAESGN